jgi:hypothetical protein
MMPPRAGWIPPHAGWAGRCDNWLWYLFTHAVYRYRPVLYGCVAYFDPLAPIHLHRPSIFGYSLSMYTRVAIEETDRLRYLKPT